MAGPLITKSALEMTADEIAMARSAANAGEIPIFGTTLWRYSRVGHGEKIYVDCEDFLAVALINRVNAAYARGWKEVPLGSNRYWLAGKHPLCKPAAAKGGDAGPANSAE